MLICGVTADHLCFFETLFVELPTISISPRPPPLPTPLHPTLPETRNLW